MKVKAILIDAIEKKISDIEFEDGNIGEMYRLLKCDCFCLAGNVKGNVAYVDDEGLLKNPKFFFRWPGHSDLLAGNGIIMGPLDDEGNHCNVTFTAQDMKPYIEFVTSRDLS